ncbi:MAG: lasso RiPP family leader peptide-containing protein [Gemmatimonadetes bacterium]|jgi:hypothetical protein|nr:lasso RiPP family leader peptide-containing protein [Gemmatimonadota bacterium]
MNQHSAVRTKLAYQAPRLEVHGDFRQLTMGGSGPCNDGVNSTKQMQSGQGTNEGQCVQGGG